MPCSASTRGRRRPRGELRVHLRVCRPARQVGSPVRQGSFPPLAPFGPRRLRVGHCVSCPVLIMGVHSLSAPGMICRLMDFSSRRVHEVVTRRAPHGDQRRDIEACQTDADLLQPQRGVTTATLDRGHVEGGGDGETPPATASPGRRPPAGPRPPPQHPYPWPCHRVQVGTSAKDPSQQDFCVTPDANTIPGLTLQRSRSSRSAVPQPECLRTAHPGRIIGCATGGLPGLIARPRRPTRRFPSAPSILSSTADSTTVNSRMSPWDIKWMSCLATTRSFSWRAMEDSLWVEEA